MTSDKRMLSVAMCTYNGGRFVRRQLQSLAEQIRPPDELVVCDDGSTDETIGTVESFTSGAPFPVHVHRHVSAPLGSTKNFERCIGLCKGDIIALCDQDDIWRHDKLAVLERALEEHPTAGFVFSDAELVICGDDEEQLQPLPYSLWDSIGFTRSERKRVSRGPSTRGEPDGGLPEILLRRNVVTGATMAFRGRFRDILLPIPKEWVHDGWIALLLSAVAEAVIVPERLLQYRQHAQQQIGEQGKGWRKELQVARRMDREWFAREAAKFELASERLANICPDVFYGQIAHRFAGKLEHQQARRRMRSDDNGNPLPRRARLALVFAELVRGRYRDYALGWKSLAQDLFL